MMSLEHLIPELTTIPEAKHFQTTLTTTVRNYEQMLAEIPVDKKKKSKEWDRTLVKYL